jgi:hypothetical protein
MEHLSDEHVIEGCFELLQKFAGKGFNVTVPRPEFMVRYDIRALVAYLIIFFSYHKAEPCSVCW